MSAPYNGSPMFGDMGTSTGANQFVTADPQSPIPGRVVNFDVPWWRERTTQLTVLLVAAALLAFMVIALAQRPSHAALAPCRSLVTTAATFNDLQAQSRDLTVTALTHIGDGESVDAETAAIKALTPKMVDAQTAYLADAAACTKVTK